MFFCLRFAMGICFVFGPVSTSVASLACYPNVCTCSVLSSFGYSLPSIDSSWALLSDYCLLSSLSVCHHPQTCLSPSRSNLRVCLECTHKLKFTPLHYVPSLIISSRLGQPTAQSPPAAANASPTLNSAECPHHSGSIYCCPDGGFSPAGQVTSET